MLYEIRTAPKMSEKYGLGTLVKASEFPASYEGTAGYSIFPYPDDVAEFKKNNEGSMSGYEGLCAMPYFPLDIEWNDDLDHALKFVRNLAMRLKQVYGIREETNKYFFSGKKGIHMFLHPAWFMGNAGFGYERDMMYKARKMLSLLLSDMENMRLADIEKETKDGGNYKGFDYNIYKAAMVLRLPNSIHPKSGLYKIQLSWEEVSTWDAAKVKERAQSKRIDFRTSFDASLCVKSDVLNSLWEEARKVTRNDFHKSDIGTGDGFFAIPTEGSRSDTFFKQACAYFEHTTFSYESILEIFYGLAQAANRDSKDPILEREIRQIVNSAHKKVQRKKPEQVKEEKELQKFDSELADFDVAMEEYIQYWSSEKKTMTTGVKPLDDDFMGHFRGKLMSVVGPPGTKKSFYGQYVALLNMRLGERTLYSSMEMSCTAMFERMLDQAYPGKNGNGYDIPLSRMVREQIETKNEANINYARELMKVARELYTNNFIISSDSSMTAAKYKKAILKAQEIYGKVGILIVDGLSMMDSSGNEVKDMDRHSKELKELAKDLDIFVIMLVHVNRGGDQFHRDHRNVIRGSQKINDNTDLFVFLSNMVDLETSSPNDIKAMKGRGVIKFWAKRGTGLEETIAFDFNPITKSFIMRPEIDVAYEDNKVAEKLASEKKEGSWK